MPRALPFTHCITCKGELKRSNIVRGNCMTCHKRLEYQNNEDIRKRVIGHTRNWQRENNGYEALYRKRLRIEALTIIGNGTIKCCNCGCDDERFIEINHIHGGGTQQIKRSKDYNKYYRDIKFGRRSIRDLNLLCRVCNSLHYLQMKYGEIHMSIKWGGDE